MNFIKLNIILALIFSFNNTFIYCYKYRLANTSDIPQLLNILDIISQDPEDNKKVLVLPIKFRRQSLDNAINKHKIFVAADESNNIISMKKLFVIKEAIELKSTLYEELKATDEYNLNDTFIYNGGEYTLPAFRQRGIMYELTKYAYNSIKSEVLAHVQLNNSKKLILLAGFLKENLYRLKVLIDQFKAFIVNIENKSNDLESKIELNLELQQYIAFKPSFDASSEELTLLPEDPSLEGLGNIISFNLHNLNLNNQE